MTNKREISLVRSSAAKYLTFVAATGQHATSVEMRYEDENIWLTVRSNSSRSSGLKSRPRSCPYASVA